MRVLIATDKPFSKDAVEGIKNIVVQNGHECLLLEKYTDKSQLIEAVANVEAIIVRSDLITAEVLEAANNLKIVVRAGAGYDNIDTKAATAKGVVVMNTPGQNSNAVAELAFGMMVYLARGCFDGGTGTELRAKKIGIHAFGYVGKLVAEIAKGFGMQVYAYDPFISQDIIKEAGVIPVDSAEELYKTCQYISLHIPATEKTKNSINFELLNCMPKGATLVNTARKEVVCEKSLLEIMESRKDFKYISDIAPSCANIFAEKYAGRYYFTPKKMGAQTNEANVNAGFAAAEQISKFFATGDISCKVN